MKNMYVNKIRQVGYYTSNTQNMRSEDIYIMKLSNMQS